MASRQTLNRDIHRQGNIVEMADFDEICHECSFQRKKKKNIRPALVFFFFDVKTTLKRIIEDTVSLCTLIKIDASQRRI